MSFATKSFKMYSEIDVCCARAESLALTRVVSCVQFSYAPTHPGVSKSYNNTKRAHQSSCGCQEVHKRRRLSAVSASHVQRCNGLDRVLQLGDIREKK